MAKRENPDVVHLPRAAIAAAAERFPTPFFLYEEARLRARCARFRDVFAERFPGFAPLFAVKANPNPDLLEIIFAEGFGADASSEAEAWLAETLGAGGMYTGNYTTEDELREVLGRGLLLNLDDVSLLPVLERVGVPEFLSFRINPGIARGSMKSLVMAGPDAKYGVPHEEAAEAYRRAQKLGVRRFGIHAMTGSNVRDHRYFPAVAERLLTIAADIRDATGIAVEWLNIGGGFGVPYRPDETSLDLERAADGIRRAFDRVCRKRDLDPPTLMAEPGRWILADCGWLVGRVHVVKEGYKTFAGLDCGMNDLPRPAIYDAYHHLTVLGPSGRKKGGRKRRINVVGRLCENNDQFARDRLLPPVKPGDLVVIHNAGAHAYAMGHNYNNRLRSAEILHTANGKLRRIRRAETVEDLVRTTRLGDGP
ncbi:MAG: diaminopimelate decarboxylase [Planctomycetota bacterium]